MFLSVVIPVYNEEKTIKSVLDVHVQRLGCLEQWEIVCLDDASTDGTWDILRGYASRQPRLRLIRHDINQGISYSFQQLFQEARGEYIYLTAGDGQWPAANLTHMLEVCRTKNADLVIGVRQNRKQVYNLGRRILSWGFNFLAESFLHVHAEDVNGIKLGRREIFTQPVHSKSFFAEVERLALAHKKGYHIVQTPILFLPRLHGKPQGARWGNVMATLMDFIRLMLCR